MIILNYLQQNYKANLQVKSLQIQNIVNLSIKYKYIKYLKSRESKNKI